MGPITLEDLRGYKDRIYHTGDILLCRYLWEEVKNITIGNLYVVVNSGYGYISLVNDDGEFGSYPKSMFKRVL